MVRLWAPAASRIGTGPWMFARGSILDTEEALQSNTPEDNAISRAAKSVCLASLPRCMQLLVPLRREPPPSALLSMAAMEALGAVVCEPGAQTTDPPILSQLLSSSASLGRPLFQLVMHPARRVADGAALVMRAVAESGATAAMPMREAALREGAFLHHLTLAIFAKGQR
jgi:DnaJ family protein C protein 13